MSRTNIKRFTDIPNVGKAIEKDFFILGLSYPQELTGKDPYNLYEKLCEVTGKKHDPCVIDVFISAVRYMQGAPARKWWEFTKERKQYLAGAGKERP